MQLDSLSRQAIYKLRDKFYDTGSVDNGKNVDILELPQPKKMRWG